MNVVTKLMIVFFLSSFICNSQTKEDVYFYLDKKNDVYMVSFDNQSFKKGDIIHLLDKKKYELYKRKKESLKKERKYYYDSESGKDNVDINVPSMSFEILRKETITHCDTHFLNLVNYKWIQDNSWKENNPNVLFKDLYFLLKIKKDEYLKLRVERTLIAY